MLYLSVNTQQLPLSNGRQFSEAELPGLAPANAGGPVAVVSANPNNPSVLGLKNLSTTSWQAVLPSGSVKQIEPDRTVKLNARTKIILGSYAAEVIDPAGSPVSFGQSSTKQNKADPSAVESGFREVLATKEGASGDSISWNSRKRWISVIVGVGFLSGLVILAINFKPDSPGEVSIQSDPTPPTETQTQQPPGGEVNTSQSYRPLSLDTSNSSSSTEWGSSTYDYKNGISPNDQYPAVCAFSVTDGEGNVVKDPSKVEFWACRIEASGYDSFYPVYWSDGKSTKYKFFANNSGKVIGTNGEEESFEWYNSSHKGVDLVVVKHGSESWTWIPGKITK
jgi:hypothetical protein